MTKKQKHKEDDLLAALIGTTKSTASLIPVLGQAIAGYDAYKRNSFERNIASFINHLNEKLENLEFLTNDDWYKTTEGTEFSRKVLAAALDDQIFEKQELFVNCLINGQKQKNVNRLEKLKFLDLLRNLSFASLMVLADLSKLIANREEKDRNEAKDNSIGEAIDGVYIISSGYIYSSYKEKYDPYLVEAAFKELLGQGLFSTEGPYLKNEKNEFIIAGGESDIEYTRYTPFTSKFINFILI